jgi:hypothetical protein
MAIPLTINISEFVSQEADLAFPKFDLLRRVKKDFGGRVHAPIQLFPRLLRRTCNGRKH